MKTILLSAVLLMAIQASDCATAGSIQDSKVTKAKRELDAEVMASPTPIKTEDWPAIHERNQQFMGIDKIDPCYLPENPTANQIDAYQRRCNANSSPKLPQRPRQAPEVAER